MALNIVKSGTWGECLWGIDDTGFMVIDEGRAASIANERGVPWHDCADMIVEVKIKGEITLPEDSSLCALFKDCVNMEKINLAGLDTSEVVDMSGMFENCIKVKEMDLSTFDTVKVTDMSRMFYGCKALTNLDLSSFTTVKTDDMHNMFNKCKNLYQIVLGDRFSTVGSGNTDCGNLSIRETGKYRMAKVVNVLGGIITYHENRGDNLSEEIQSITGYRYTVEKLKYESPSPRHQFMGWNTRPDGKGDMYMPGDEIANIDDDINLYAIWSCPPSIGKVDQLEEITYGQPLPFNLPDVYVENDDPVKGYLEISPTGDDGTWKQMEKNEILPVKYNGYYVRLVAENECGKAYSNVVTIRIKKAGMDLTKIHWAEDASMVYDGSTKKVWLEGLPEGVTAIYENNSGIEAGERIATVELEYDEENYDIPFKIKPHPWTIKKARIDMTEVIWDYKEPFTYDGTEKSISLLGVPDGIIPHYERCVATEAGIMTATVTFTYDTENYEKIEEIIPCVWEIRKAYIEANKLRWTTYSDFVYNGEPKSVELQNLPDDARVEYFGNEEILAGKYLARATLVGNYYTNEPIELEWEIAKARFSTSSICWDYEQPFGYDRQMHEVRLLNVPEGLAVKYYNNVAMDTGEYEAIATFTCEDTHNYATPSDAILHWKIQQGVADMSNVRWNYTEPFNYDGGQKSVELEGLPDGVFAIIENGTATQSGVYRAHANLQYDKKNFIVEQPADCQWQINKGKYDISNVRWNYEEPFTYDGEEKVLFLMNVPEGLNVEYTNNVKLDAGKYVATARLMPSDPVNYEIPEINACTWAINKLTLDRGHIAWTDDRDFVYDGTAKSVKIISEISDKIRVEYSGEREIAAGQHEAIATFFPVDPDNYEAPTAVRHVWSIAKGHFDFKNANWNYTSEFTYDGTKKSVELTDVPEGVIVSYENNEAIDGGDYLAIARFELMNSDNYYDLDPMELRWSIRKNTYDLTKVSWQENRNFKYDGSTQRIELIGLPDNIIPIYENNAAVDSGEYIAEVDFEYDENNYEKPTFPGCRWSIEKAEFDIGNARWDYIDSFAYDGEVKSVQVIDMPPGATIEYSNAAAVDAGIYFATAEVIAEDDRNFVRTTMPDLAWKIEKGNFDMSNVYWDYDGPFAYDGTERQVVLKGLPEGIIPMYVGNREKESGEYVATVTFKVVDSDNYNTPEFPNCTWKIEKAEIDMSEVEWNYTGAFTYANRMHEVKLVNLPKGVKAIYSGNCATDAGIYRASVEFSIYDTSNYYPPSFQDCNWEIVKADYDMSEVRWDYNEEKTFNGREQGVYLENLPNGVSAEYTGNTGIEVGAYSAMATLSTNDPGNYNNPSIFSCDWIINRADVDMSNIRWNYTPGEFVYDGSVKKIELENVPDYVSVTYSGETATNAGHYIATAEFNVLNPNYNKPDTINFEWYIERAVCDMSNVKWDYNKEFTYNGQSQGIEVIGLPNIVTAHCENNRNVNAGTYVAVARFTTNTDNYSIPDDMTCEWKINKTNCDISDITWDYSQPFTYDGRDKIIKLAGVPDNLRVNYTGNIANQAGEYMAMAEFIPVDEINYYAPEPVECRWEIAKADYDMSQTRWSIERKFTYNRNIRTIYLEGYPADIIPICDGNTATDVGKYTAFATFEYDSHNYNEPVIGTCDWEINKSKYDMAGVYWDYVSPFSYNGELRTIELRGLPEGLYPIYENNTAIDSGEYEASVTFEYDDRNYEKPEFGGCKWAINKAKPQIDASAIRWSYTEPFVYDGTPKGIQIATYTEDQGIMDRLRGREAAVQLYGIPDGFEVVSYEENEKTDVGVYYAKAILRHETDTNYTDFEVPACRWEIKKASIDMSNITWGYDKPFTFDGSEKTVELIGLPESVTVTYTNNAAIKAGSYEAQAIIDVKDPENFEKPKPIRGCWWTIEKASYDMSRAIWAYADDIVYDGKEKTIEVIGLPEGVEIESYRGNRGMEAGTYIAEVKFRYLDPENYETPILPALRWRIQKQRINTEEMVWNYTDDTTFVYDGKAKEVALVGVPNGVEVLYINNTKINAGTYVAKARLSYDTKNYEAEDVPDLIWQINRATYDTSEVRWSYDMPFKYDGEEKKVALQNVPSSIIVRYMDNRAISPGSYTAKAYLSYNTDNYEEPNIETSIEWEIEK